MCLKEKNPVVPKSLKVNYWGLNDLFFSTQGCCLDIPKMPVFLQNVDAWSKFKPRTKNRFECIHEDLENDLYQQFVLDCAIWHGLRDFENIIPNTIILEVCSYACYDL